MENSNCACSFKVFSPNFEKIIYLREKYSSDFDEVFNIVLVLLFFSFLFFSFQWGNFLLFGQFSKNMLPMNAKSLLRRSPTCATSQKLN